jgi:hypothetical protein
MRTGILKPGIKPCLDASPEYQATITTFECNLFESPRENNDMIH